MKRSTIAILVTLGLATGCTNMVSSEADDRAKLAAYAAQEQVPTTEPTQLMAGATLLPDHQTLQITNFSDTPLSDVDVWVNRSYVQHVDLINADAVQSLPLNRFYSKDGTYLGQDATITVQNVQVSSGGKLYNLLGPANQ